MNLHFDFLLKKPRLTVWRAFDNPENLPRWQPTLLSFTEVSGSAGQTGAVAKLVYKQKGRLVEMTETITLRMEPEMFSAKYESPSAITYIDNHFISLANDQTQWIINAEFQYRGFCKLFSPLIRGSIQNRARNDMLRFKTLLESNKLTTY